MTLAGSDQSPIIFWKKSWIRWSDDLVQFGQSSLISIPNLMIDYETDGDITNLGYTN